MPNQAAAPTAPIAAPPAPQVLSPIQQLHQIHVALAKAVQNPNSSVDLLNQSVTSLQALWDEQKTHTTLAKALENQATPSGEAACPYFQSSIDEALTNFQKAPSLDTAVTLSGQLAQLMSYCKP